MIDWVTAVIPCWHDNLVHDGQIISISPNGEIQWKAERKLLVRGSDESAIHVRTSRDHQHTHLYIDGNPVKFLQGHNLWGTDDLIPLVYALMQKLTHMLGLNPTERDIHHWATGFYDLKKIDINYTWHLSSKSDVLAWIRAAEQAARLRYRGNGVLKGNTLYFGKHSRRWGLKAYSKGEEVSARGHELPERFQSASIVDWANRSLRLEVRLQALELKERNLHFGSKWGHNRPYEIHQELLSGLEMSENYIIPDADLPNLPGSLTTAYLAWKDGHDLRAIYSRPTFYRYRNKLLAYGIDIANVQSRDHSNVVPLIRVLEAKPVGIPEWALTSDLYFDPPKIAVNSR
jgi:II/X family phage/plasmid replication protein